MAYEQEGQHQERKSLRKKIVSGAKRIVAATVLVLTQMVSSSPVSARLNTVTDLTKQRSSEVRQSIELTPSEEIMYSILNGPTLLMGTKDGIYGAGFVTQNPKDSTLLDLVITPHAIEDIDTVMIDDLDFETGQPKVAALFSVKQNIDEVITKAKANGTYEKMKKTDFSLRIPLTKQQSEIIRKKTSQETEIPTLNWSDNNLQLAANFAKENNIPVYAAMYNSFDGDTNAFYLSIKDGALDKGWVQGVGDPGTKKVILMPVSFRINRYGVADDLKEGAGACNGNSGTPLILVTKDETTGTVAAIVDIHGQPLAIGVLSGFAGDDKFPYKDGFPRQGIDPRRTPKNTNCLQYAGVSISPGTSVK